MIKPIITNKKLLSEKCDFVSLGDCPDIVINDLKDTAATLSNFAGLSAPQIGHRKRVILVNVQNKLIIMINPTVIFTKGKLRFGNERCYSVPSSLNKPIRVRRWFKVKVIYQNEQGDTVVKLFKRFEARLIQHEIDHLDGVLIK